MAIQDLINWKIPKLVNLGFIDFISEHTMFTGIILIILFFAFKFFVLPTLRREEDEVIDEELDIV